MTGLKEERVCQKHFQQQLPEDLTVPQSTVMVPASASAPSLSVCVPNPVHTALSRSSIFFQLSRGHLYLNNPKTPQNQLVPKQINDLLSFLSCLTVPPSTCISYTSSYASRSCPISIREQLCVMSKLPKIVSSVPPSTHLYLFLSQTTLLLALIPSLVPLLPNLFTLTSKPPSYGLKSLTLKNISLSWHLLLTNK